MAAAAAALGHAARRLGGGALRQTREAAVSRLSSRFAHTEAQISCSKLDKDAVFKGIQQKTEELYEAVAEAHQRYGKDLHDSACGTNKELLRQLSDHVCDRTGDATWEFARREQKRHDMLKLSGFCAMALSGYSYFLVALTWALH